MTVRAKFQLSEVVRVTDESFRLVFNALYDDTIEEDRRFAKATPTGHLEMQVDNPKALEQFRQGHSYYLDFSEVPAPKPAPKPHEDEKAAHHEKEAHHDKGKKH